MNKTMLELINACDETFSSGDPAVNAAALGAQNVNSAMDTIDGLRQQLADVSHERDLLRVAVTELESGLRIIAVARKGSGLGALKLVAKQSLNRSFATEVKS